MFPLKIGSRASALAQIQVKEIIALLPQLAGYTLLTYSTGGDKDKTTPLTAGVADNFFTDAIDQALLTGQIDIAIHSAKDLPQDLPENLEIIALTKGLSDKDAWVGTVHWNDLPKGARVGTSSILRQQQIKKIRPDLNIIDIRGTIQERIQLVEQKKVDGIVVALCAMQRLGLSHLVRDIFPWEGMPLQGQLAVVARCGQGPLQELFAPIDVRRTYGRVVLVGAGPGDPSLLTLKGIKALEKADCIFYDYLADPALLKFAPLAEHIYAGKRKGQHSIPQDELSRLLRDKAMEGKNTVRLKGGDPLIFGRGADEIAYLRSYHIPVDIVPGISSATGIASLLGVPLTARGISQSVAFVSAHGEDEDIHGPAQIRIPDADTIVFLMGLTKLPAIISALRAHGAAGDDPILIVSNGTRLNQHIVPGTLDTIELKVAEANIQPPAIIIFGKVVGFYKSKLAKTFLFCGTHPESYARLGRIIPWTMIDLKPIQLSDLEKEELAQDFDWAQMVLLTSPSAVKYFMHHILPLRTLEQVRSKIYAVIGKHSAADLAHFHVHAHLVSDEETAQGLYRTLSRIMDLKDKKVLFPRSHLPNPFLKDAIVKDGAIVREWAVYDNVKPAFKALPQETIDGVIFTSPSTVVNFIEDYQFIPKHWQILVKGPVTQKALEMAGYQGQYIP